MDAPPHPESPPDMIGVCPPEHDVRGRVLILLIYGVAGLLWGTVTLEAWSDDGVGVALAAALFFVVPGIALADAVHRFECWAWFVLMPLLLFSFPVLLSAAATVPEFTPAERMNYALFAAMLAAWVHYLWVRRWDFWRDERLDARREVVRHVTPQWRAARLARIRAGSAAPPAEHLELNRRRTGRR